MGCLTLKLSSLLEATTSINTRKLKTKYLITTLTFSSPKYMVVLMVFTYYPRHTTTTTAGYHPTSLTAKIYVLPMFCHFVHLSTSQLLAEL